MANLLYAKKESDFKQMFIKEYKQILVDIKKDIQECNYDLQYAVDDHMEMAIRCQLDMLVNLKHHYEKLIASCLN